MLTLPFRVSREIFLLILLYQAIKSFLYVSNSLHSCIYLPLSIYLSIYQLRLCDRKFVYRRVAVVNVIIARNVSFVWLQMLVRNACEHVSSQITLQYIMNESKHFHTYVANRTAEIHEITSPDRWRHCPGKLKPQKLIDQYCWWKRPEYLWKSEENWPQAEIGVVWQDDPEVRDEVQVHSIKTEKPDIGLVSEAPCASDQPIYKMMTYNSSWLKLKRCTAWLVHFCHWLRNWKTSLSTEALTSEELQEGTLPFMRLVQAWSFPEELRDVKAN